MTDVQPFEQSSFESDQSDTCILYCENYLKRAPNDLSYSQKPTCSKLLGFNNGLVEYNQNDLISRVQSNHQNLPNNLDVLQDVKFKVFCEYCLYFRNYTHFECKHFKQRGRQSNFNKLKPSKKCVVCANFGSDCPVLKSDKNLFKRLIISFGIKLHIGDDDPYQTKPNQLLN